MGGKINPNCGEETYMGEIRHSVDAKGRVTIPSGFREALGEDFILTKGLDRCLWLQSRAEWQATEDYIRSLDHNIPEARMYARFVLGGTCHVEPDKQGRILIPPNLREYAGLTKDVVFNAGVDYVEIWDSENFDGGAGSDFDIADVTARLNEIAPMKRGES
ncbi:MAG: division/cell wall cluster transcriptional repressor MraZ [Lachnospiraceae bacterium]|nr:division/cell wall cluster transcriptional repressor MraZ [Lachnospiraceae bacterium]